MSTIRTLHVHRGSLTRTNDVARRAAALAADRFRRTLNPQPVTVRVPHPTAPGVREAIRERDAAIRESEQRGEATQGSIRAIANAIRRDEASRGKAPPGRRARRSQVTTKDAETSKVVMVGPIA